MVGIPSIAPTPGRRAATTPTCIALIHTAGADDRCRQGARIVQWIFSSWVHDAGDGTWDTRPVTSHSSHAGRVPAPPPLDDQPVLDGQAVIDEVAGLLRARGERMTGPRRAVLSVLAERGGHLSADALLDAVASLDPRVHRASVYRTLEALSELGVVQHVHVGHGGTAYHLVRGAGRHLHAQCRVCGSVRDLPPDLLNEVAATLVRRHDFVLDAGHVALSGLCRGCIGDS